MLRSVKHLQRFRIVARDGELGSVDEFYFDDQRWTIRYLVVDTGRWLPGRRVLISPYSVRSVDWIEEAVLLSVTREMVKNSPHVDTHKPVSRVQEAAYLGYYGYPWYWAGAGVWGPAPFPAAAAAPTAAEDRALAEAAKEEARAKGDTRLRSSKEVIGYHLEAADGGLGHVEDFLVEDRSWTIRYIVVDTRNWWFGKHVLVPPDWAREISWSDRKVYVDLARQAVKNAPEYDSAAHLDRQWEADYYEHHHRRPYWDTPLASTSGDRRQV